MKKILIISIIFITSSCGYQPLYSKKSFNDLEFKMITLKGNKNLNQKIINTLSIKENKKLLTKNELTIETNIQIFETSKNTKGQVKSYRSTAATSIIIKNDDIVTKNKKFVQSFSYNNKANKYELKEYQKEIEDNLVNKIIEELIIYMNL
tara:strand:+ start:388 stop:837 length:450 start_codon:yes stop_codon:yes gene_type:complete